MQIGISLSLTALRGTVGPVTPQPPAGTQWVIDDRDGSIVTDDRDGSFVHDDGVLA